MNSLDMDDIEGATSTPIRQKRNFVQEAVSTLYPGDWIVADQDFYKWVGTHYEKQDASLELRRLAEYCDQYAVPEVTATGETVLTYPHANPGQPRKIQSYARLLKQVPTKSLNPSGMINYQNGVIELDFSNPKKLDAKLIPHDPSRHLFTYQPTVAFDPHTPQEHCDQLLSCLDPDAQAASSHLIQFCQDTGLRFELGAQVSMDEVYQRLVDWYQVEGWFGADDRLVDLRPGDQAIRAKNKLTPRLKQIFPQLPDVKRIKVNGRSVTYFQGLTFTPIANEATPLIF